MRKNILLKSMITAIAILMLGILLSGCGQKVTESDINYAGPMLDNILTGIKDNNYEEFSKDFSSQMKNALTQDQFSALVTFLDSKIGDYEGKTFAGATNTSKNGKTLTVVVYKAKYSNETKDVLITITFGEDNGKKTVDGLFFKSPNLEKQ